MAKKLVLLVVALCLVAAVSAKTKSYLTAYKGAGGVDKYVKFADQVCAIMDAASGGDFDKAKSLYNTKVTGYADSLKSFATTDFKTQRYNGMAQKYWGAAGWLDDFMMNALEGTGPFSGKSNDVREQGVLKTAQSGIAVQLILKELDTAGDDMAARNYDNSKGAPHALDEAWAVFSSRPECGVFNLGQKYANQFGTIQNCEYNTSTANIKIVDNFVAARDAAKAGDKTKFDTNSDSIVQGLLESHIQGVLNYAKKMSDANNAKAEENQAEGYMFYRTIAPFIAEVSPTADKTIKNLLDMQSAPTAKSYTQIKAAFESVYTQLKVNTGNIGAWQDSPQTTCASNAGTASAITNAALASGLAAALVAALW